MKDKDKALTSVKLDPELFDEFKILGVRTKMTFAKLADRALYLYVTNLEFRNTINNQLHTSLSGSVK